MPPRYFTPEEANETLASVRPLTEELVNRHRELAAAQQRRAALAEQIAGNGGGIQPSELAAATEELEGAAAAVARCLEEIAALGGQVKDLDEGLVDFPELRGGEEVLLCWKLGEDEVGHWHGVEEGFAGRRPLPL